WGLRVARGQESSESRGSGGNLATPLELDLATGVLARPADRDVLAAAAEELVPAGAALEVVVPRAPDHLVATGPYRRQHAAAVSQHHALADPGAQHEPAQPLCVPEGVVDREALDRAH